MLQEFLQYLATVRRFSPLTVQNYRRDVTNFLEWLDVPEADFDPRRITVEDVREWIVHRTETKHLGAASMNRELSSLRSFFRYLHRTGRIDKEVMYRIHALKTSRRIPAFVPSTRMEGILDELDRESESPEFKFVRNSLIVLLFYSCGLRLAELVGIDRDDFSGDYTALKVRGKGDKERKVYFDAKAKVHLKEYIERRTDQNEALFVTLDAPHDRLKISGVEIRLRKLGRRLDLERIHPHKFRRTMATRAIDKGMPIEQVQKILGHSQIDTTMQYAMVNQSNVKTSHQKYMG